MKAGRLGIATILAGLSACATAPAEKPSALREPPHGVVNVTNDLKNRYGEVQLAINPKNPNNMVIAINQMGFSYACKTAKDPNCDIVPAKMAALSGRGEGGAPPDPAIARIMANGFPHPRGFFTVPGFTQSGVFVSMDRGKTWKRVHVPVPSPKYPDLTGWGDPSVAAAPDGTFYLSYDDMDWGTPEKALVKSIVGVSKSTDGGLTWTSPEPTGTATDSPKTAVDQQTGTIYHASGGTRQLVMSKDGVTWSKPQRIGGTVGDATFSVGIGDVSMGTAHGAIAFSSREQNAKACALLGGAAPCAVFQITSDGGATWERHRVPATGQVGGPTLAADPTKKGHFTVAVLSEKESQFQIFQTRDAGKTWSNPTVIANDPTKHYYHPWAAYSSDGVFGLAWRARQPIAGQAAAPVNSMGAAGKPLPYNTWAVISRDGGTTVSAPLKVNAVESPAPDAGVFGNSGDDYSALAMDHGYAFVAWPDWSPGDRSGLFRAIKYEEFKFEKR